MTNLSSTDSSGALDQDATGTVTLDEVRDSNGVLIAKGGKTYDKTLRFSGTSLANTNLNLRDAWTVITPEPFKSSTTQWFKTLTLEHFKNYGFSIIEADPPQGSSTQYAVIVATKKPTYESVVGENGPIQSGEPYEGDSVTINGRADPGGQVQAFDGETPLGDEVPVDKNGLFKILLEGLEPATYNVQIVASNDEKSEVFVLKVQGADPTSIDDVLDDENNPVPPGGDTIEKNLTLTGQTRVDAVVRLVGGVPTPVEVQANGEGKWSNRYENLRNARYSITAELIDNPRAPTLPRIFTVRPAAVVELLTVTDGAGKLIEEDGITHETSLFVNCKGEEGKKIQVFDGTELLGEDFVANGTCKIEIGPLSDKLHKVRAVADYPEGGESRTYSFTVETRIQSKITIVNGENDQLIENGDSTESKWLIIRGDTAPGQETKLQGAPVPPKNDIANDKGKVVFFIPELPSTIYTFTIQPSDDSTPPSPDYVVTVLPK